LIKSEGDIPTIISNEQLLTTRKFSVHTDKLRFNDGMEISRDIVSHPGAVAIIAEDEFGDWLMIKQYRHSTGRILLEIPAGTKEAGEPADLTAARELREETGYSAKSLTRIGGAWMAPGWCTEYIDFFIASQLEHSPLAQDFGERIGDPIRMKPAAIEELILSGRMEDAKTILAFTYYKMFVSSSQ